MKQISNELYAAIEFIADMHDGEIEYNLEEFSQALDLVVDEINRKRTNEFKRKLYSIYKTAQSPELKETARNAYLDERGIPEEYRY